MAKIYYYDPQSTGINMQSPQKESTPRRLTLVQLLPWCSCYPSEVAHMHNY
jgi:hypothetical protein